MSSSGPRNDRVPPPFILDRPYDILLYKPSLADWPSYHYSSLVVPRLFTSLHRPDDCSTYACDDSAVPNHTHTPDYFSTKIDPPSSPPFLNAFNVLCMLTTARNPFAVSHAWRCLSFTWRDISPAVREGGGPVPKAATAASGMSALQEVMSGA